MPVWIADYVLAGYGTGAVMAVPAHDERDFEFASIYALPIKQVVAALDGAPVTLPFVEEGISCNSGVIDSLSTESAKARIIEKLEEKGLGSKQVAYTACDTSVQVNSIRRFFFSL